MSNNYSGFQNLEERLRKVLNSGRHLEGMINEYGIESNDQVMKLRKRNQREMSNIIVESEPSFVVSKSLMKSLWDHSHYSIIRRHRMTLNDITKPIQNTMNRANIQTKLEKATKLFLKILGHFVEEYEELRTRIEVLINPENKNSYNIILHSLFISLGDLFRYIGGAKQNLRSRHHSEDHNCDIRKARGFYIQAIRYSHKFGVGHNQLSVLAIRCDNSILEAIYRIHRALLVKIPFNQRIGDFFSYLNKRRRNNNNIMNNNITTTKKEYYHFEEQFIRLHGFFLGHGDIDISNLQQSIRQTIFYLGEILKRQNDELLLQRNDGNNNAVIIISSNDLLKMFVLLTSMLEKTIREKRFLIKSLFFSIDILVEVLRYSISRYLILQKIKNSNNLHQHQHHQVENDFYYLSGIIVMLNYLSFKKEKIFQVFEHQINLLLRKPITTTPSFNDDDDDDEEEEEEESIESIETRNHVKSFLHLIYLLVIFLNLSNNNSKLRLQDNISVFENILEEDRELLGFTLYNLSRFREKKKNKDDKDDDDDNDGFLDDYNFEEQSNEIRVFRARVLISNLFLEKYILKNKNNNNIFFEVSEPLKSIVNKVKLEINRLLFLKERDNIPWIHLLFRYNNNNQQQHIQQQIQTNILEDTTPEDIDDSEIGEFFDFEEEKEEEVDHHHHHQTNNNIIVPPPPPLPPQISKNNEKNVNLEKIIPPPISRIIIEEEQQQQQDNNNNNNIEKKKKPLINRILSFEELEEDSEEEESEKEKKELSSSLYSNNNNITGRKRKRKYKKSGAVLETCVFSGFERNLNQKCFLKQKEIYLDPLDYRRRKRRKIVEESQRITEEE